MDDLNVTEELVFASNELLPQLEPILELLDLRVLPRTAHQYLDLSHVVS